MPLATPKWHAPSLAHLITCSFAGIHGEIHKLPALWARVRSSRALARLQEVRLGLGLGLGLARLQEVRSPRPDARRQRAHVLTQALGWQAEVLIVDEVRG